MALVLKLKCPLNAVKPCHQILHPTPEVAITYPRDCSTVIGPNPCVMHLNSLINGLSARAPVILPIFFFFCVLPYR